MNFTKRLRNFLLTVGIGLLFLFFLSDYTQQVQGWYFLAGLIAFGLGIWLAWRSRETPEPTQRFRLVRRVFGGKKKDGKDSPDA